MAAIENEDGAVFANSLDVAEAFEKDHKNILRDIKNMTERGRLNFELSSYTDNSNRKKPMYEMNRDAFMMLVNSFSTERAIEKYDFEEGVDFTTHKFVNGKATQTDYIVTMDMAKELCMVSKS